MAPIVHCVRHAQGEHNIGGKAYLIPDPQLTEAGVEECKALEARFPFQSSIGLIVSSPLRRALQTALCSFQPAIRRGVRIVALPELQETSDVACDTGSDAAEIRHQFSESKDIKGTPNIDFGLVEDGWNSKTGKWVPSSSALISRARAARRWLKQRPEKEVVVVCHGGFLHYLTEDWTEIKPDEHASAWRNCEFRTYKFINQSDDNEATLIETNKSRQARGVANRSVPTKAEQHSLYLAAMQDWEGRGFQNPLKLDKEFS